MSLGAQNMKTGPGTLSIAKNESENEKIGKREPTPSIPPKMSRGVQKMRT
jgi:hypothetical protein